MNGINWLDYEPQCIMMCVVAGRAAPRTLINFCALTLIDRSMLCCCVLRWLCVMTYS